MSPMLEVVMRPPDVFVRELSPEEGLRLRNISRKAKYQSKRQRAMILLASATGMSAPQIAGLLRSDESHVRKVIHAFNEQGFHSLDPDYRGGRPRKTTPEQRERIVAVARTRPDHQGVPLTRWSLPKLRAHLAGIGVDLSEEALRQTLIGSGLSDQRTRSWKWSPDPDFQGKAERVLPRVVRADELGDRAESLEGIVRVNTPARLEDLMPTAADAVEAAPAASWRRPAIFALFAVILPAGRPTGSLGRVGARASASRVRRRRPRSSTSPSAG